MSENNSEVGIRFFGTMMASISHELKNRVAIIKEYAGLLSDYSEMAAQGREIDMARLGKLGKSIDEQVLMTDEIIKKMNRFSHSVDDILRPVDVSDLLGLLIALAKRSADRHRIELKLATSSSPISITTSPFFLMNLLWLCLRAIFQNADQPSTVEVSAILGGEHKCLITFNIKELEPNSESVAEAPSGLKFLSEAIEANIEYKLKEGEILIHLPADVTDKNRLTNHGQTKNNV
jgi:hypothetical protein